MTNRQQIFQRIIENSSVLNDFFLGLEYSYSIDYQAESNILKDSICFRYFSDKAERDVSINFVLKYEEKKIIKSLINVYAGDPNNTHPEGVIDVLYFLAKKSLFFNENKLSLCYNEETFTNDFDKLQKKLIHYFEKHLMNVLLGENFIKGYELDPKNQWV